MIFLIAWGGQPTDSSAARNAPMLSGVLIPVSINAHSDPLCTKYTLTIVGLIGNGR